MLSGVLWGNDWWNNQEETGHLNESNSGLTAAFLKNVTEAGKSHDGKGLGLFLLVKKTGAKSWVQRIVIHGKRREIGLGSPPVVSLAEARDQALNNKRVAYAGRDLLAEERRVSRILSFEEAARKAHADYAPALKNPKDRAAYLKSMETCIFPQFGAVALPDVTSADVRRAILLARDRAPGVARKLVYRVSAVFKWGIAEGMCTGTRWSATRWPFRRRRSRSSTGNPCGHVRQGGGISRVLPRQRSAHPAVRHLLWAD